MAAEGTTNDAAPPLSRAPARWTLKLVVVAAVVAALMAVVDVNDVLAVLRRLPLVVVLIAAAALSLDRVMMGVKWRHLVRSGGASMRLADAVSIYYQSKFTTLVFPASLGGEVLRGVLGARAGVPSDLLVASMIVERIIAAVSSLVLAGIGLVFLSGWWSHDRRAGTVVLLVAAVGSFVAATVLLALHRPSHKLIGRAVRRWVPERLFRLLDRLSRAIVQYKHAPRALLANFGLTVVEQLLQIAALGVLAEGLGARLPFVPFLAVTSIVMLVRRGVGFLEGWGLAESGVVMLYTLFGVTSARSAALGLALWAVSLLVCLPGGYLLWRGALRSRGGKDISLAAG